MNKKMFFMMGITQDRKNLEFCQMVICDRCGKYGRYNVFMTYTVLSLFFIPVFKWGKKYFVQMSCCETVYQLNPDVGRRIEHGERTEIHSEDIQLVNEQYNSRRKHCNQCGFSTEEEFIYCPKCGRKF